MKPLHSPHKILAICALILFFINKTQGQSLADYIFFTGIDSTLWEDMSDADSLSHISNGWMTTEGVTDIGFDFPFCGRWYNQFSVNELGDLRLGPVPISQYGYTMPFSYYSASYDSPKICAIGTSAWRSGSGQIKYKVVGSSPYRKLVVEYSLTSSYTYTNGVHAEVQIHLAENGDIVIQYGHRPDVLPQYYRQVGLCVDASDGYVINSDHTITHFTNGTSSTIASNTWPENWRTYRFQYPTSCLYPQNITHSQSDTSVTLAWDGSDSISSWNVQISGDGQLVQSATSSSNSLIVSGLQPNIDYTATIYTNCSDGSMSYPTTTVFTTLCAPITESELPWLCNFESEYNSDNNTVTEPCLQALGCGTTSILSYPNDSHDGSNYLELQSNCTSYLLFPYFNINTDSIVFSFWIKNSKAVEVGLLDYLSENEDNFISLKLVEGRYNWQFVELTLADYTFLTSNNSRLMLAIKTSNKILIDNVAIERVTDCNRPFNLSVSHTDYDAKLQWTALSVETDWVADVVEENGEMTWHYTISDSTVLHLDNLLPATGYYVTIRPACDTITIRRAKTIHFKTACEAISESALPWEYGFEPDEQNQMFNCFTKLCPNTSSEVIANGAQYHRGNQSLLLHRSGNATSITLPLFESETKRLRISFWMHNTYSTSGVFVGVKDNADPYSIVDTIAVLHNSSNGIWEQFHVDFDTYDGSGRFITLFVPGTQHDYKYIDDILIEQREEGVCASPTGLVADELTSSTATLHWRGCTNSDEQTYRVVYYRQANRYNAASVSNEVETSDTSITIDGLASGCNYIFQVSRQCNDDTFSSAAERTVYIPCGILTSTAIPYVEDFELHTSTNGIPECWGTAITGSIYPTGNARQDAISGEKSLFFHSDMLTAAYAVLPPIDASVNIHNLMVRFAAKKCAQTNTSHQSKIDIGVMTDPDDTSTFMTMQTIDMSALPSNSVKQYEVSFENFTGYGDYIALRATRNGYYNDIAIDNVQLLETGTCMPPTYAKIGHVSSNSVSLSWNRNGAMAWDVYVSSSAEFTHARMASTIDTMLTIDSLNSQTLYYIRIVPICNNGHGIAYTTSIKTSCLKSLYDLPYSNININEVVYGHNITIYDPSSYYNYFTMYGGIRNVYIGNQTTNRRVCTYLALPTFNTAVQDLCIHFAVQGTNERNCMIGVMSNPYDLTTFDTLAFYHWPSGGTDSIDLCFSSYSGNGKHIAIMCPEGDTSALNQLFSGITIQVSNIIVSKPYNCLPPRQLHEDSVGADIANVSWEPMDCTTGGYQVVYSTVDGFNPDTAGILVFTNSTETTLTGLQPSTHYYWRVATSCNNGNSEWSEQRSFCTANSCSPMQLQIFHRYGSGDGQSQTAVCYNNRYADSGFSAIMLSDEEVAQLEIEDSAALSAIILTSANDERFERLRIYAGETTQSGFTSVSDTTLFESLSCIYDSSITFIGGRATRINLSSNIVCHEGNGLIIVMKRDSRSESATTFESTEMAPSTMTICGWRNGVHGYSHLSTMRCNIGIVMCNDIPLCRKPKGVAISALTDDQVTFHWHGESVQYQYICLPEGSTFNPNATGTTINDTTVTVSNLQPSTNYNFYVRSICGSNYSSWTMAQTFTTACQPSHVTFNENFEQSDYIPACWHSLGGSGVQSAAAIDSIYQIQGQHNLRLTTNLSTAYAVLPLLDATLDSLTLMFDMRLVDNGTAIDGKRIVIGTMMNPLDSNSFIPFDTVSIVSRPLHCIHRYTIDLQGIGQSGFPAIKVPWDGSTTEVHIDNILIFPTPHCQQPRGVTAESMLDGTILVSWMQDGAAEYEVCGGFHGWLTSAEQNAIYQEVTSDTSLLIYMSPGNDYDIFVRAICNDSDTSLYSDGITVSHTCGLANLPNYYDFQSFSNRSNENFNNNMPHCWNTCSTYNSKCIIVNNDGNNQLIISSKNNNPVIAILPPINDVIYPMNANEISFSARIRQPQTFTVPLVVGIMSTPYDTSSFTPVASFVLNSEWNDYYTTFQNYNGNGFYIAFRMNRMSPDVFIDNIFVDETTHCSRPVQVNVDNITYHDAKLEWNCNGNLFETAIKRATDTQWPVAQQTTEHYMDFSDLDDGTLYDVRVRTICSTGVASMWVTKSFSTDTLPCISPTNMELGEITMNTIEVDWQPGDLESQWQIRVWNTTYDTILITSFHPVTISGLKQNVEYRIAVRGICTAGNYSLYTEPQTFTTAVCPQVVGVNADRITATTVTVSWNSTTGHYEIEYGPESFEQGSGTTISNITDTTCKIEGLTPNKLYNLYVRTCCSEDDYSLWSARLRFRTEQNSIEEMETMNERINIYPNPTGGNVTIECTEDEHMTAIDIIDLTGTIVRRYDLHDKCPKSIEMQLKGLSNGSYLIRIATDSRTIVKRVTLKQ